MSNSTVFNIDSDKNSGELFLPISQGLSIQRFDNPKYPQLLKLLNTGLSFFWLPEEISMAVDASNFPKLGEADKHVVISNIKRQILLDSIMGRAPVEMFGKAVNDTTLESLITLWQFQETIHSKSYTHIIQNSFTNPKEVLRGVMDIEGIVKCSETITAIYDNCIDAVDQYYNGRINRIEAVKAIYLTIHAANALESIRFIVSFACSYLYAENGLLPGLGNIITLINRDEHFHNSITNYLIDILPKDDEDFKVVSEMPNVVEQIKNIWVETYNEESEWIDYLFIKGNVLGLNANTLRQYLGYITANRLKAVGIGRMEDLLGLPTVTHNPLNWVNSWSSNKGKQHAPQETELTNYQRGIMDMDFDMSKLSAKF